MNALTAADVPTFVPAPTSAAPTPATTSPQPPTPPLPPAPSSTNHSKWWIQSLSELTDFPWCSERPPATTPCASNCTPTGQMDLSECGWYLTDAANWLPWSYASAASCACTLKGAEGQLSPSAECVRRYLHDAHTSTQYFTPEQKAALKALRDQLCIPLFYGVDGVAACAIDYAVHLQVLGFPAIVHQLHQDAYRHCCCPHQVAPLWMWWGIMYAGRATSLVCEAQVRVIEWCGRCGCEGW